MYICLCNAISDKNIKKAVDNGAKTVACVYKANDCKMQCGKCACQIKDILLDKINKKSYQMVSL